MFIIPEGKLNDGTYSTEGLLVAHEVDHEGSGSDEEDLHEGVVQGNEVHEEVHVAQTEH